MPAILSPPTIPAMYKYHPDAFPMPSHPSTLRADLLRRPSQAQVSDIEHDELRLEDDVAEDGKADSSTALHAAETLALHAARRVVHVAAGHGAAIVARAEGPVRQVGVAVEDVAAGRLGVARARDLVPVGGDDVVREEEESGSCVRNGGVVCFLEGAVADRKARGSEFPEAPGRIDGYVRDGAGVLGRVDEAEVVVASGTFEEVGGE